MFCVWPFARELDTISENRVHALSMRATYETIAELHGHGAMSTVQMSTLCAREYEFRITNKFNRFHGDNSV